MYTKPQIKKANKRYYIEFYYRGERLREYNGSKLSLPIFPNRANTAKGRKLELWFHWEKLEQGSVNYEYMGEIAYRYITLDEMDFLQDMDLSAMVNPHHLPLIYKNMHRRLRFEISCCRTKKACTTVK